MTDEPHPLLQALPLPAGPVRLRALRPSDAPAFLAYRGDPAVARFQGWLPMDEAAAVAFLGDAVPSPWAVGDWAQIGIAAAHDDHLLGDIGLLLEAPEQVQIGFSLARHAQGRGWALAAVDACLRGLLSPLRVRRVRAITDERNAPSCRLLQRLSFVALERIEVALRVDVSHTLGRVDCFAYLKPELFHRNFSEKIDAERGITNHHEWVSRHSHLIKRSKEEFVRHNRMKYGLPLAIWVACEVWDFGTLSTLFGGMREADQDAISTPYGVSNGRVFATWLRSLNYLRNVCAHHSRLWNRNMVDQPRLPARETLPWIADFETDTHAKARCYLPLLITRELLRAVNPSSSWPTRLRDHLETFPDLDHLGLNLAGMGASKLWRTHWE